MNNSWLVQRLNKPYETENDMTKLANAFSFGGGLKNGGLSKEAMQLLSPLFSFDYMGSAEFEFGAVPETMSKIVKNRKDYIEFSKAVKYQYKDWSTGKIAKGTSDVYIICNRADKNEVIERIENFAIGKGNHTKEGVNLDRALSNAKYSEKYIGWLELDNGYLFFRNEETGKKTAELFLRG